MIQEAKRLRHTPCMIAMSRSSWPRLAPRGWKAVLFQVKQGVDIMYTDSFSRQALAQVRL